MNIVLTTFKVSEHKTLLVCLNCDGIVGEWADKIYPTDKKYSFDDLR